MLCKFCGAKNPDDSLFCKKCGKSLEKKATEVKALNKITPQKDKPGSKLPLILGITIPLGIIIIAIILVFTGIIPLLNQNEPVADAGEDINTSVGEVIVLNGSGSYDSDGDNLIYLWEVDDRNYEGETIEMIIEKQGVYTAKLLVQDSRYSSTDSVIITVNRKNNTENQVQEDTEIIEWEYEELKSIPWSEAKDYIGETVMVYGPVVATYYDKEIDGGTTFLNIGKDYPDPEGFSAWIPGPYRSKFSQAPEIYYSVKSISVTGLIVEVDGIPHMKVTDPSQISIVEEVEELAEEPKSEPDIEPITEEEQEEEPAEGALSAPTVRLEIIEGPSFSQLGDNTCYYRVKAYITGNPSPTISFNKDDSMGSLGGGISQVNLHNKGESFTLEVTSTNSQGTASDSITLTYACQDHIPILVKNDTGGTLTLSISGPGNYNFSIPPGQQNIYVIPGTYNYTAKGCGGAVLSGTYDLSKSGDEWDFWCQ